MAWNIVEAAVAILAGVAAGSIALVGFGVDSLIEVTSGGMLVWRLRKAGPEASAEEQGDLERKALFVVGATFFLLAAYVAYESLTELLGKRGKAVDCGIGALGGVARCHACPRDREASGGSSDGESSAPRGRHGDMGLRLYLSAALLLGLALNAALGWWWADAVAGLAMLPVILWQGWETLEDARE